MHVTTSSEAARELQLESLDQASEVRCIETGLISRSYFLPVRSAPQTILAQRLSRLLLSRGESWLQITYWNVDSDSNQELFYGYRKGHGETRQLKEASVHRFAPDEVDQMASILGMVIYFRWDARIFDRDRTYLLFTTNDEIIDYHTCSPSLSLELDTEYSHLEMKGVK